MSKRSHQKSYLRYTEDAVRLLGYQIRLARVKRNMSSVELAERAGIFVGTLQKIEYGDMEINIGTVFECASLVGVCLFEPDERVMALQIELAQCKICLLTKQFQTINKIGNNF